MPNAIVTIAIKLKTFPKVVLGNAVDLGYGS